MKLHDTKLWVRLVVSIWLAIVVSWAAILLWAEHKQHEINVSHARDFAGSAHQMTMAGLTGMMITGTIAQREVFLDQIKQSNNIESLQVLRGQQTTRQFGPGTAAEMAADPTEAAVLASGKPFYEVSAGPAGERLRAVLPVIALSNYLGKDCLGCHQVKAGTVLGAVSMKISLAKGANALAQFQRQVFLIALLLSIPLVLFVYVAISRIFTRPLKEMTAALNQLAQGHTDQSHHLPSRGGDEIGQATRAFNRVMDKAYELTKHQRMASAVFEHSLEGILICDRDRRIQMVNRAFTETTGYSAQEAIGQEPKILSSGRQDAQFYQSFWRRLLEDGQWQGELWNKRKNGEIYPEWLNISTVKNSGGEIEHFIAVFSDITERKRSEETIAFQAYHDVLTGLPNQVLFRDRLEQALALAMTRRHEDTIVAVMFLDLDRFKIINDTLGHDAGDQLLRDVADRLRRCVRESDTVARQGGDEFTILLPKIAHAHDVFAVGNQILAAMKQAFVLGGKEMFVSTSIGISLFPADGEDADSMMKHANTAMYHVKSQGRAHLHLYDDSLSSLPSRHLELSTEMHKAIERDEFLVLYQPQIELDGGTVCGTEALIRWNHPHLGMLSPIDFIPLAEDTGLIIPIGARAIETACMQAQAWNRAGISLRVAVNLSARQFDRDDIVNTVKIALQESGLPAQQLELEITESLAMRDVKYTIKTLHALADLGVQLAMDDFGTGYSSLSYLKRFPLHTLKIDKSFISNIAIEPRDAAIVRVVIDLGHSLNLTVVAEGVDCAEQLNLLRSLGCDSAQGYLFSRPQPAADIERLLGNTPRW